MIAFTFGGLLNAFGMVSPVHALEQWLAGVMGTRNEAPVLGTIFFFALALAPPARAHDGPPYPILVDREVGSLTVSVWSDPDVGIGTFYF